MTLPNGNPGDDGYFVKDRSVKQPSQTPIFYDQTWTDSWPIESSPGDTDLHGVANTTTLPAGGANSMKRITKARHGSSGGGKAGMVPPGTPAGKLPGSIEMGFADGHAQNTYLRDLWTLYWHAQWNPNLVINPTAQ